MLDRNGRGIEMTDQEQQKDTAPGVLNRFVPGLAALSRYEVSWLPADVAAGLSVAAVALPVGIAYSAIADVPAVLGIYAAIFPLFAYALFGTSRQLIVGPDAATILMMAAALAPLAGGDQDEYLALMTVMTLIVGLIYVVGGAARLGFIASFLSMPILVGFMNGIAFLLVLGQLPKMFGYSVAGHGFFPQLIEFATKLAATHPPTLIVGAVCLVALVALRRFAARVPAALVIICIAIAAVYGLDLHQPPEQGRQGVAVLGAVPAGLPEFFHIPLVPLADLPGILGDAAGLALVSFTAGILTAKGFAQRNNYEIDANQELVAFGAANLASGLAQGFAVTGAGSRTAVNDAVGGKSQMVGIVAGGAMLLILFFLTEPLAYLPSAALGAVIIVAAWGLFDFASLRNLYGMNRVELVFSVVTTLGVLILGVLPGILIAVILTLLLLLGIQARPRDAVLGRVPGMKGFHDRADYPEVETVPGLLMYRFEANVVFFNADYFRERILAAIAASDTPVEWVVVDAVSVNIIDSTAIQKIDQLREELTSRGIEFVIARRKLSSERFFEGTWVNARRELTEAYDYTTLKAAIQAFEKRDEKRSRKGKKGK